MKLEEGRELHRWLVEFVSNPGFVYKHRWGPKDLVMWDNRSLMHRGNTNYDMANESRVLQRTVIIGTKPF